MTERREEKDIEKEREGMGEKAILLSTAKGHNLVHRL